MARSFRGYEIEKKIGAGGMATLYLGIQKALNRQVAIKMLHPGLADDESFISRFEREAKTASSIGHRNIVSVFDFGVEDDVYYIVMELVRGLDAKHILGESGPFPAEIVLAMLEEVSYGLEAAHKQGVIHRDIKPGNVMLSEDGEVKVADFGLARESSDIARMSSLTLPGSVLGTPAYMSPEQATGKEIDHRTDVYSLGVMAFELLTGEKPFTGASYSEIRDQIINSDPPPLVGRAAVTSDIERLVHRMMERDPDRRYPSMRHVIRAIEDSMESLDPTGGLIKYRRKYLSKFAAEPGDFANELRNNAIAAHLDRGFYFKQMGLAKIDDAVSEFRFVLAMDPDNSKANTAIFELEKQAEESGVRLPGASDEPKTRRLEPPSAEPPAAAEESGASGATPPPAADPTPLPSGVSTSRPDFLASDGLEEEDPSEATRVLGSDSTAPMATQILSPEESGITPEPAAREKKKAPVGLFAGIGAALLVAVALLLWKPWAGSAPAGVVALSSEPAGAAILVKGPEDTEFRAAGQQTPARLEGLEAGTWEVRLELADFKPAVRRVPVGDGETPLHVAMAPLVTDGRFTLATTPAGAKVFLKRPSETEFREVGETPYESGVIQAGLVDLRAVLDGTGEITRSVQVPTDAPLELAWNFETDFDRGRIAVLTEPAGASVRVRRAGDRSFRQTGLTTPATVESLAVGEWEVRLDKSGFERTVVPAVVVRGDAAQVDVTLEAAREQPKPPPARDGYAKVVVSPFADVYLDGRQFATEQRRTVIPLRANRNHKIELRHRTFGSKFYENVKVAPGDTLDLGLHKFEWAQVRVYCAGGLPADLLIDGKQVDRQTPFSDRLTAGEHTFLVRKAGFYVADVILRAPDGSESHPPRTEEGVVKVDLPPKEEVAIQFVLKRE